MWVPVPENSPTPTFTIKDCPLDCSPSIFIHLIHYNIRLRHLQCEAVNPWREKKGPHLTSISSLYWSRGASRRFLRVKLSLSTSKGVPVTSSMRFQCRVFMALLAISSSSGTISLKSSIFCPSSLKAGQSFRAFGSLRHLAQRRQNSCSHTGKGKTKQVSPNTFFTRVHGEGVGGRGGVEGVLSWKLYQSINFSLMMTRAQIWCDWHFVKLTFCWTFGIVHHFAGATFCQAHILLTLCRFQRTVCCTHSLITGLAHIHW